MPESARPYRKQGRRRERRRRARRFLLPAQFLRAPVQIAATPSRARRPFESRRRSRRTVRADQAAARGQAGREFGALRRSEERRVGKECRYGWGGEDDGEKGEKRDVM